MTTEKPIITLLTDFGSQDVYVGVIKGTIAAICPNAHLIDLTHHIPPQDVTAAALALLDAYPYFPKGTIYLAVVDPGVGSNRPALALRTNIGYFVGPDNGLFAPILAQIEVIEVVILNNPCYWRTPEASSTFHGRDIFAPAAAHLARGIPLQVLGDTLDPDTLTPLPLDTPQVRESEIIGQINSIDIFGNLITNIPGAMVQGRSWCVILGSEKIQACSTYAEVPTGEYVALIGSNDRIEIGINGGSAQKKSGLNRGDSLRLQIF